MCCVVTTCDFQRGVELTKKHESGAVRRRCNLSHAQKRSMERYNLDLDDFGFVVDSINKYYTDHSCDGVEYIRSDSFHADRHIYSVKIRDFVVPVVWCETTKSPVTFLPPSYLKTVPGEFVPDSYRQCCDFIDALGQEMNRITLEIRATAKGSPERVAWQKMYEEKQVELNRLKLVRDTRYEITPEMREHGEDAVFLVSQLRNFCMEMLHDNGLQAEEGSALQFILASARKFLKSHGKV